MIGITYPKFCSADIPPGCLTSGILLRRHYTQMSHIQNSSPSTFHPNISHPTLDAGWEKRAFQIPRSDISGSFDSAYPESFFSKLRKSTIQCFKRWAIQSWNEGITVIASRSLQDEGRMLHDCEISLWLQKCCPFPTKISQPFCTVPRCSPEASWYVRPTFWDILL